MELFDRAVIDGWAVDGAPGFVYTTDWSGQPVVRQRMYWVLAEAIAAAAALHQHIGSGRYLDLADEWWQYAGSTWSTRSAAPGTTNWIPRTGPQQRCGPANPTCTTPCKQH